MVPHLFIIILQYYIIFPYFLQPFFLYNNQLLYTADAIATFFSRIFTTQRFTVVLGSVYHKRILKRR